MIQFFLFIFVAVLAFVLVGIVRALMYANRMRRAVRDLFTGGRDSSAADNGRSTGRRAGTSRPKRAKKIGRDVGEYVEFEEITAEQSTVADDEETTSGTGTRTEVKTEQQVTDIEWEDL